MNPAVNAKVVRLVRALDELSRNNLTLIDKSALRCTVSEHLLEPAVDHLTNVVEGINKQNRPEPGIPQEQLGVLLSYLQDNPDELTRILTSQQAAAAAGKSQV